MRQKLLVTIAVLLGLLLAWRELGPVPTASGRTPAPGDPRAWVDLEVLRGGPQGEPEVGLELDLAWVAGEVGLGPLRIRGTFVTDAEGRLRVELPPPSGEWLPGILREGSALLVEPATPGHLVRGRTIRPEEGKDGDPRYVAKLSVHPGAIYGIQVNDQAGRRVDEGILRLTMREPPGRTLQDDLDEPDRFRVIAESGTYDLVVLAPGRGAARRAGLELDILDEDLIVEAQLGKGPTFEGRVLGRDGLPLAGIELACVHEGLGHHDVDGLRGIQHFLGNGYTYRDFFVAPLFELASADGLPVAFATTDAEGRFRFEGLRRGSFRLRALAWEGRVHVPDLEPGVVELPSEPVEVTALEASGLVRIVDAGGTPRAFTPQLRAQRLDGALEPLLEGGRTRVVGYPIEADGTVESPGPKPLHWPGVPSVTSWMHIDVPQVDWRPTASATAWRILGDPGQRVLVHLFAPDGAMASGELVLGEDAELELRYVPRPEAGTGVLRLLHPDNAPRRRFGTYEVRVHAVDEHGTFLFGRDVGSEDLASEAPGPELTLPAGTYRVRLGYDAGLSTAGCIFTQDEDGFVRGPYGDPDPAAFEALVEVRSGEVTEVATALRYRGYVHVQVDELPAGFSGSADQVRVELAVGPDEVGPFEPLTFWRDLESLPASADPRCDWLRPGKEHSSSIALDAGRWFLRARAEGLREVVVPFEVPAKEHTSGSVTVPLILDD